MTSRPLTLPAVHVKAILAGRKTQMRIKLRRQPHYSEGHKSWMMTVSRGRYAMNQEMRQVIDTATSKVVSTEEYAVPVEKWLLGFSPHKVGDVLWAKETWSGGHSKFYPHFPVVYRADDYPSDADLESWRNDDDKYVRAFRWRSAMHMPQNFSRLSLELTNVGVQRVQEISDADAIEEGIIKDENADGATLYTNGQTYHGSARAAFAEQWGDSWEADPFVWAMTFRVEHGRKGK